MVNGAIEIFADGSELEGEPFAWIEVLQNLSNPDFSYEKGHPLEKIIFEITPYELAKIVDCAVEKYRPDLKGELKRMQKSAQRFAVECMVNQAYTAGAREMLIFGIQEGVVTKEAANLVQLKIDTYWEKSLRIASQHASLLLSEIKIRVTRSGKRGQPARLEAMGSYSSHVDRELLVLIDALAIKNCFSDRR